METNFGFEHSFASHDVTVEWWYFHGEFQDSLSSQWNFMLALFKTRTNPTNSPIGFSCIMSMLNRSTGEYKFLSKIDASFLQNFLNTRNEAFELNIDPGILRTFFEEYKKSGPPRPIQLSTEIPEIKDNPFSFSWDSLKIVMEEDFCSLSFELPPGHKTYHFCFNVSKSFYSVPNLFKEYISNGGMEYVFSPKLKLSGTADGFSVDGTAWIDHQWGDASYVLSETKKIVLGWDWFGVNLEDGKNILLFVHRNSQKGDTLVKYGCLVDNTGKCEIFTEFEIYPVKFWESSDTLIKYPIYMQIKIPWLDAVFYFKPWVENQEIPFFGPMRAVWQGAGFVEGMISGAPVKGNARCELNGYGYIFDFKEFLESLGSKIDSKIESFFPKKITSETLIKYVGPPLWDFEPFAYTKVLADPIWDLISRNGKRWRSIFTRLLLRALGTNPEPYDELLYTITELHHTGSLIIDDIEDNSPVRRGEEAIHLRYGKGPAINAANTLYFLPNLLLYDHPLLTKDQKYEINGLISNGFIQGHLGQGLDLYWTDNMNHQNLESWMQDSMENKILQMYAFKTAAGLGGLAETAAIISGKDENIRKCCKDFAIAFGVAFQIIDDIHSFNDSENWKKTFGEDLKEGKLTYVIYKSLLGLEKEEKKFLVDLLCSPEKRKDTILLKKGAQIVRNSGVLEKCRKKAKKMVEDEWEYLSVILPASDQKLLLRALYCYLLDLNYEQKTHIQ